MSHVKEFEANVERIKEMVMSLDRAFRKVEIGDKNIELNALFANVDRYQFQKKVILIIRIANRVVAQRIRENKKKGNGGPFGSYRPLTRSEKKAIHAKMVFSTCRMLVLSNASQKK